MKNLNILITGYRCVGTSSLIDRIIYNNFRIEVLNTVGIDFKNKKDENFNYRFWIVPDKYNIFTEKYKCDYYILVFDITNRYSFEKIEEYYKYFIKRNKPFILIGNMIDKIDERIVKYDEAYELSKKLGIKYYIETSALSGEGINDIFNILKMDLSRN